MTPERKREIQEACVSISPGDRDPADTAIGELLVALDEAEKERDGYGAGE